MDFQNITATDTEPTGFVSINKKTKQNTYTYTHTFVEPITIDGCSVSCLTFDWGSLTANDSLIIENELQMLGKTIIAPEFSAEYLLRMAVRACTTTIKCGGEERRISTESFSRLPLADFNKIRSKARSFLLRLGS